MGTATSVKVTKKSPFPVRLIRQFRSLHKYFGLALVLVLIMSSITGILLAWRKDVSVLQPPTQRGASTNLADWRSLQEVHTAAVAALAERHPETRERPVAVDRYDARPDRGIAKVQFVNYWEVQIDMTTLAVLSVQRRNDDIIEKIHDLSIINDLTKIVSMTIFGLGLLLLSATGFWLWYGPRRLRRQKHPRMNA
jgi:uncharacterized iron-regulated membrane protein